MEKNDGNNQVRYHHIPFLQNGRFSGRFETLSEIQNVLDPEQRSSSTKSIALFGMGGVGKTQLALQYIYQNLDTYGVILWIAADNIIAIDHSFREVAQGLHLDQDKNKFQDSGDAIWKVKNWLNTTSIPWLIVFDNVDDLQVMKIIWPTSSHGSILLTTRNFDVANNPYSRCIQLEPFDEFEGTLMLIKQIGLDPTVDSNAEHATAIVQVLGGLPLALSQIGGFIAQRKLPLKNFIPLYERNAAKIDSRKTVKDDYEHTLSTVWDVSFQKLPEDATRLLNLLIFFDPDGVDEAIFLEGSQTRSGIDSDFDFIADEMDLGDAEQPLLQAALINKTVEKPVITIHRLIQSAAIHRLPASDRPKYFDTVIHLLSWGFPDTWSKDIGHQFNTWQTCEEYLPHIEHLVKLSKRHDIRPSNVQQYAELLLGCSWYLYERETYDTARNLVNAAVQAFEDKSTLAYASAIDLTGLINLDLCQPLLALKPFQEALEIRKRLLGPEDSFVASSLNNIALAYTEMGNLEEAYSTHQQAIDIRLRTNSDRIGNSYSNMSSLLLRMGKPDEAEEMLCRCSSLKDFKDETFSNTGNPRFSGDMMLLSRIRLQQGRLDDALQLATAGHKFRQGLLGNCLKTCDSLYYVASILRLQGHRDSAITILEQVIKVSESLNEGERQLARALYKLSILFAEQKSREESDDCKARAREIWNRLRPEEKDSPCEDVDYFSLTPWMLW
ncbi:TPR-like protein [Annulohypoxylon moriforme]|nr:TPR-like protein [Annulohypoxylon moriforme]